MTLKIIHHQEEQSIENKNDNNLNLDIKESLTKMFILCNKIINLSYTILEQVDFNKLDENDFDEKYQKLSKYIDIFTIIVGKKISIIEATSKAMSIIQKIQSLAEKFNICLIKEDEEDKNIECLTDDDIDMMVQLVKDFGEKQIRDDAKEVNKEIQKQNEIKSQEEKKQIDIYDIYHEK